MFIASYNPMGPSLWLHCATPMFTIHGDVADDGDTGCFFLTGAPPKSSKYKKVTLG